MGTAVRNRSRVLPVVLLGSERQQDELLPEVASGDRVLTAAPRASATVDDGLLSGVAVGVGYADRAYRILLPAGDEVFLVDPRVSEVSLVRTPTSSGAPEFTVRLGGGSGPPL